ncbi:SgcJ/EcaC family oxidoreductase [Streptomyces sp. NPDC092296]|uniref:SgcJ/EcaC family oxidoreductase n=1 Tax=Streptomyces sp. NPDC092296 TaxID=3366012 RepID=UPI0038152ACF
MAADPAADRAVRELYRALLEGWDAGDAQAVAAPFAGDGELIGFDGSRYCGREQIAAAMADALAAQPRPTFVAKVRGVRLPGPDTAVLQAVAGLVPPGGSDLVPERNARHTLVAVRSGGDWRIVLFQQTPARFQGRPELREGLSEELRELLRPSYDDQ